MRDRRKTTEKQSFEDVCHSVRMEVQIPGQQSYMTTTSMSGLIGYQFSQQQQQQHRTS